MSIASFCKRAWVSSIIAATLIICPIGASAIATSEKAVRAEKNPPGDIPDDQVFVSYNSPLGFALQVPEGWSRAERSEGVRFSDKHNIIDAVVAQMSTAPTALSVLSHEAADLVANGRSVKIVSITEVKLKGGLAIKISYLSNSEPNPVTNKQIRLEHARFIFFKNGKTVTLDFAAPQGADNADQWQLMSDSFRWN